MAPNATRLAVFEPSPSLFEATTAVWRGANEGDATADPGGALAVGEPVVELVAGLLVPLAALVPVESAVVEAVPSAVKVEVVAAEAAAVIVTSGVVPGVDVAGALVAGMFVLAGGLVGALVGGGMVAAGGTSVAVGGSDWLPRGACPQTCSNEIEPGAGAEFAPPGPHRHACMSPSFDRAPWNPFAA